MMTNTASKILAVAVAFMTSLTLIYTDCSGDSGGTSDDGDTTTDWSGDSGGTSDDGDTTANPPPSRRGG